MDTSEHIYLKIYFSIIIDDLIINIMYNKFVPH